ncbi:unnamed protein product [Prorocentrum cordatum]|uniref:Uncharacterized protein n=1 Tax=Prorocentrum cordatum TaxID=2364126 RepID=A0ABN9V7C1_9DINO|nr:unnamed protein product [Polarella glacialis]
MRKKAAQVRIDVIGRERTRRLLQMCLLAFQEEAVESRAERLLEELRSQQDDQLLVLNAQLSQCLGDDEKAKELIAEQVRRLEDAKKKAIELEKQVKLTAREMREWKAKSEDFEKELNRTRDLLAEAIARAERAEADAEAMRKQAAMERAEKERTLQELAATQEQLRKTEEMVRKKQKKIEYLQSQLAELGADSDSDAPPDEREPAFFLNKDGAKEPRPRTKKERVNMAKREAETARFELRLGIASMIDKDLGNAETINRLKEQLEVSQREVQEVRWANKVQRAPAVHLRSDPPWAHLVPRGLRARRGGRRARMDAALLRDGLRECGRRAAVGSPKARTAPARFARTRARAHDLVDAARGHRKQATDLNLSMRGVLGIVLSAD